MEGQVMQRAPAGRRRWTVFGSILGAHGLEHILGPQTIAALLPSMYDEFGLTGVKAGLLETTRSLGGAFASILSGVLADLFARRRGLILAVSISMLGVFYFLVGIAPVYSVALIAILPAGMFNAAWHAPALATLAQTYPGRRGLALSLHGSTGNVGDFLGPIIVGGLLFSFTWRSVMQLSLPVALAVGAALAVVLWSLNSGSAPAESLRAGLRQQVSDLRKVLSNRGILLLMLATGVRGLGTRGLSIFLALYMSRTLGMSTARVGLYLGLLTFLSIAVGPLLGGLSDRVGRKKVLLVVLVWLTLFPLTFGYVGSGLALAIVLALYGAAGFAPQPIVQAAIVDLSGGLRAQASILGLLWSSNVLFSAMAPIIGGLIADSIGYRAVFLYAAGMSAVSVLCVAIAPFTSRESVRA